MSAFFYEQNQNTAVDIHSQAFFLQGNSGMIIKYEKIRKCTKNQRIEEICIHGSFIKADF